MKKFAEVHIEKKKKTSNTEGWRTECEIVIIFIWVVVYIAIIRVILKY